MLVGCLYAAFHNTGEEKVLNWCCSLSSEIDISYYWTHRSSVQGIGGLVFAVRCVACRVYPVHLTVHTEFVFGNDWPPAKLGHFEEQHLNWIILLSPPWISCSSWFYNLASRLAEKQRIHTEKCHYAAKRIFLFWSRASWKERVVHIDHRSVIMMSLSNLPIHSQSRYSSAVLAWTG